MKTLQIAAGLLVAHFGLALSLALVAPGGPDYVRLAMMLAFVATSVGALLRPRGRGWIFVVAYCVWLIAYQGMGAWSTFTAPMPSEARMTAGAVWVLITALPATALGLTVLPGSLAQFKGAAADERPGNTVVPKPVVPKPARPMAPSAAPTAPGEQVPANTHALRWMVVVAGLLVAAVLVLVGLQRQEGAAQWLTPADYQRQFDAQAQKGFYPHEVNGECQDGTERFRAEWRALPEAGTFYAHHGMTQRDYERRNGEYSAKGFSMSTRTSFKDCKGADRYQATWLKR